MVLIITALIFGKTNRPGGAHDIKHINKATISINGLSRDVTLPFKIKNQDSRTKISVSFLVMPEDDNVLCVKSNYAPFDVSIDNNVLVSYSEKNCPFYMIDPPTSLFNVVIPESEEQFVFDKESVLQNGWMYDQITKVVPTNQIAIIG